MTTRPHDHDDEPPQAALGWQLVLLRALASHCRAAHVHPDDARAADA